MFGLTNNAVEYERAIKFREDAIADGWIAEPRYNTEAIERAARLKKDGFVMSITTRESVGKWKYEASVYAWGPDGLAIRVPKEYSGVEIFNSLDKCLNCGSTGNVSRVGFAGRYCEDCAPAERERQEYPGWTK